MKMFRILQRSIPFLTLTMLSCVAIAEVITVGPSGDVAKPSQAAARANDGDIIEIDAAGVYDGDVAVWRSDRLNIRGVNGRPHIRARNKAAQGKAVWVVKGDNTTIENVEISGAQVKDKNGAAIRQEGAGLILRHCYLHHNENGLLAGAITNSDIVIEHCEFSHNGYGDGYSHNMYIGTVRRFTLRYSYVHHARVGHNVKSRALENHILYNRIMDEQKGTASYAIDLPNGGSSFVIGNEIQQGPRTQNSTIVAFNLEQHGHARSELFMINNTLVNDRGAGYFLRVKEAVTVVLANNLFIGKGRLKVESAEQVGNLMVDSAALRDRKKYDYRLVEGSPAIDAGGVVGNAKGIDLAPAWEYAHPANNKTRARVGVLDVGAHEYTGPR